MHGLVPLLQIAWKACLVLHPLTCLMSSALGSTCNSEVDQTDVVASGSIDGTLSKDYGMWEHFPSLPLSMAEVKAFFAGQRTRQPPKSPGKALRSIHILPFLWPPVRILGSS